MMSAPLIAGFDKAKGIDILRRGDADAIAYGPLYIANPDLVARLKADAPLSPIPLLSMARVPRATPTIRRCQQKTGLRSPARHGASRRMFCPGARRDGEHGADAWRGGHRPAGCVLLATEER
jgi:hypothetical protein